MRLKMPVQFLQAAHLCLIKCTKKKQRPEDVKDK